MSSFQGSPPSIQTSGTTNTSPPSTRNLALTDAERAVLASLLQRLLTTDGGNSSINSTTGQPVDNEHIPAEIFSTDLAPAESLVKYLKENLGMNYHAIGQRLSRDERGIWGTYRRASKKIPDPLAVPPSSRHLIPLSSFSDRNRSILQVVVEHLHRVDAMRFVDIAKLLKKSYSTIYTTHLKGDTEDTEERTGGDEQ